MHQAGIMVLGIEEAGRVVVDDAFVLDHQLMAPGRTLAADTDCTVTARLYLHRGWTWSVEHNTGSGCVTGGGAAARRPAAPGATGTATSGCPSWFRWWAPPRP